MNCTTWMNERITLETHTLFAQSELLVSMSRLIASRLTEKRKTKREERQGFASDELGFIQETSTCAILKVIQNTGEFGTVKRPKFGNGLNFVTFFPTISFQD
jgi:hypothetical protein